MSKRKQYTKEFKLDAVNLVIEQGYSRTEAARRLGINTNMLARWINELADTNDQAFRGNGKLTAEQEEIKHLRASVKRLEMEKDILIPRGHKKKRRSSLPKKRNEICIHYPAQEDLASWPAMQGIGCQSQRLLQLSATARRQSARPGT